MQELRLGAFVCVVLCSASCIHRGPAVRMYQAGKVAEKKGEFSKAYLLYSKAAALAPENHNFWLKSQAVRTRAALQAKVTPPAGGPEVILEDEPAPEPVTDAELLDARKPQPPAELKASDAVVDFNIRANARSLFEQVARAYGLDCVFDGDYPEGGPLTTFRVEQSNYREALHALQAATSSFIIPLTDKVFMVAKDTQQKRADLEPAVTVTIPIPAPVTVQEAQELARSVQQAMEIRRFGIDNLRRLVVLSDRISKIRPAQKLFEELLSYRTEVAVELEFLEVARNELTSFGLDLPGNIPIGWGNPAAALPKAFVGYAFTIGGGSTLFSIGIPNPAFIARASKSSARTLLKTTVRSGDGLPATFHVGDRYPILTGGFFGEIDPSQGEVFRPPPQFNFEDLGLVVKITPKVHGSDEMSLAVEAEFKVLTGAAFNDIPVISNRKLSSQVRVKTGELAVVAGMMTSNEARTISGIAGLAQIPGLSFLTSRWSKADDGREVLILLRPFLVSSAPDQAIPRTIWVGPEGRLNIPL